MLTLLLNSMSSLTITDIGALLTESNPNYLYMAIEFDLFFTLLS